MPNDQQKPNGEEDAPQDLWDILNAPAEIEEPTHQSTPEPPINEPPSPASEVSQEAQPGGPETRELHPEDYIPQDSPESAPASTDSSIIQRILSDPTAVSEEGVVDYSKPVADSEDFDSAIRAYHYNLTATVSCKNHPDRQSVDYCPECEAYYCQECMVIRKGRMLCSDCAEALFTPTEDEILSAQEMGLETPTTQVTPDEQPEFQLSGSMFGLEGRPTGTLKRIIALMIDLVIIRGSVLCLVFLLGLSISNPSPFFHLFDNVQGESTAERVINALFLFRPMVPWLIVIASVDFLYFFFSLSFTNRTIGMSWTGCRVVGEWGDFVSFGAIALRTLVFMVCLGFPAIMIAGFFPAFRGPHDYVAGTVVINYSGVKRIDAYESIQIKL